MSTNPTNSPIQNLIFTQTKLEKKLKKDKYLSRILAIITTLAIVETCIFIICASFALIPWSIVLISLVITCFIILGYITELTGITKTQRKLYDIKTFLENNSDQSPRGSTSSQGPSPQEEEPLLPAPEEAPLVAPQEAESLLPAPEEAPLVAPQEAEPFLPLGDFASMLEDENLRTLLFPLEETSSINPATWFSLQRLNTFFLNNCRRTSSPSSNSSLYRFLHRTIFLSLQTGTIFSFVHDHRLGRIGGIVNSTNPRISSSDREFNSIVPFTITNESWKKSKGRNSRLRTSEVCAGRLFSQRQPDDNDFLSSSFLIHVLAPQVDQYTDPFQAYSALILAYKNCLEKAHLLGINFLQIPLLSSPNFDDSSAQGWVANMSKLAFLTALTLFLQQNPSSSLHDIALIHSNQPV